MGVVGLQPAPSQRRHWYLKKIGLVPANPVLLCVSSSPGFRLLTGPMVTVPSSTG
jgi:hypothetical protein